MSKFYERQEYDTDGSWLSFQDYLGLPKPRTLKELHRLYVDPAYTQKNKKKPPTSSLSTLRIWCNKKEWKSRAAEFDRDQSAITIKNLSAAQQEEDLKKAIDFRDLASESGKVGSKLALKIKEAIAKFMESDFEITSLDEAYKASRIVQSVEASGLEMWAQAIGVTKVLDNDKEGNG